ncbi:hypothetical protein ABB37_02901 [Leptomonas pyrrhocoris]|uniref:Uncharacterized protein n=1 Tax=Leptomonas pyrrhocoris TaxID=157538 RepID=A0A0N1J545_LEPPY|nr:hypothetical protein ABB37_02901 [Leptomonas pyrrhocoris]KPA83218.1 hypothetical protein ABB37_02901 [Leptomonas pyrrhocoris]|eukprot:XP_015661657.1 hypothetical protein ABB37_02901 [Leptomonas pyrrhocoris]
MATSSNTTTVVPSFATVTLAFSESDPAVVPGAAAGAMEPKTMRVPISSQTTVRELAKGAMARYMFSLRRTAKSTDLVARQLFRTGIVVTDVHLRSFQDTTELANKADESLTTHDIESQLPPCRIELFSDDCVVHVVQVREEVVYMRFKAATERSRKRKGERLDPTSKSATSPMVEVEDTTDRDSKTHSSNVTPSAVQPVPDADSSRAMPAEDSTAASLSTDDDVVCVSGAEKGAGKGGISIPMPLPPFGVAPVAAALLNYATTSKKTCETSLGCDVRPSASSPSTADDKEDDEDDVEASTSSERDDSEAELLSIARSIATLRQDETRRMPWGPDAYKHFATNYVNSPQKIMTGRYNSYKHQLPPPSVKLHHNQSAPKTVRSPHAGMVAIKELNKPAKEPPVKQRREEKVEGGAPLTSSRIEEISSCDDSQVSVMLSCGSSSRSITPSARAVRDTLGCVFPPAPPPERYSATATVDSVSTNSTIAEESVQSVDGKREEEETQTVYSAQIPVEAGIVTSTTPANAVMGATVSLTTPSTVAKPVQGLVARQLSFDEECESGSGKATKQNGSIGEASTQAVQVLSVQRMSPCA